MTNLTESIVAELAKCISQQTILKVLVTFEGKPLHYIFGVYISHTTEVVRMQSHHPSEKVPTVDDYTLTNLAHARIVKPLGVVELLNYFSRSFCTLPT